MKHTRQVSCARGLRRQQTDAEKMLWSKLRNMRLDGVKFRRQQPLGGYIVDFVSFERKLIIEVDGGQHNETRNMATDEQKTMYLENDGFHVLRCWNNEVLLNMDGVLTRIKEALK